MDGLHDLSGLRWLHQYHNFSSGRHEEHFSFQPQLQKVRLSKVSNYLALYAASMASGGLGTKILLG